VSLSSFQDEPRAISMRASGFFCRRSFPISQRPAKIAAPHLGSWGSRNSRSGWYWQITCLGAANPGIRSSRSLFAAKLPRLSDAGVPAGAGGARRGYTTGPDDRDLRMIERVIDTGDQGIYLVQVAGERPKLKYRVSSSISSSPSRPLHSPSLSHPRYSCTTA
jgi:hypothetical protein